MCVLDVLRNTHARTHVLGKQLDPPTTCSVADIFSDTKDKGALTHGNYQLQIRWFRTFDTMARGCKMEHLLKL